MPDNLENAGANDMKPLTKQEVIQQFSDRYGMDISDKLRFKVCDHSNNPLAPEKYCYKLYFNQKWIGRQRLVYWPNSVGMQGF